MSSFEERMDAISKVKGIEDKVYVKAVLDEIKETCAYSDSLQHSGMPDDLSGLIKSFELSEDAETKITLSEQLILRLKEMQKDAGDPSEEDRNEDDLCPETLNFTYGFWYRSQNVPVIRKFFSLNYRAFIEVIGESTEPGKKLYHDALEYMERYEYSADDTVKSIFNDLKKSICILWLPPQDIEIFQMKVRAAYQMILICFFNPLCSYYRRYHSPEKIIEKYRMKYDFSIVENSDH